jgi:hypothetical protein
MAVRTKLGQHRLGASFDATHLDNSADEALKFSCSTNSSGCHANRLAHEALRLTSIYIIDVSPRAPQIKCRKHLKSTFIRASIGIKILENCIGLLLSYNKMENNV